MSEPPTSAVDDPLFTVLLRSTVLLTVELFREPKCDTVGRGSEAELLFGVRPKDTGGGAGEGVSPDALADDELSAATPLSQSKPADIALLSALCLVTAPTSFPFKESVRFWVDRT